MLAKEKRTRKKELTTMHPHHMTDAKTLEILVQNDWKKMKEVHQEATTVFSEKVDGY